MRDKESTKARILQEGKKQFLEKGFEDTHMRIIARQAGVTTGAIYGHFKSKHDLFCYLVQPVADGFIQLQNRVHTEELAKSENDFINVSNPYKNFCILCVVRKIVRVNGPLILMIILAHLLMFKKVVTMIGLILSKLRFWNPKS